MTDGKHEVELQAGPELDAKMADKVMGWPSAERPITDSMTPEERVYAIFLWSPSTSITDAMEVVEKITKPNQDGTRYELSIYKTAWSEWSCTFMDDLSGDWIHGCGTLPLAICRAALKVMESK